MTNVNVFDLSVPVKELAESLQLTEPEKRSLSLAHPCEPDVKNGSAESHAKGRIYKLRLVQPLMFYSDQFDDMTICFQRTTAGERLLAYFVSEGFEIPDQPMTLIVTGKHQRLNET